MYLIVRGPPHQVHAEALKQGQTVAAGLGEVEAWQLELSQLMSASAATNKGQMLRHASEQQGARASAYDELRALDHSLQLSGSSLAAFLPHKDRTGRLLVSLRLGKHETRRLVPSPEAPPYPVDDKPEC